MIKIRVGSFSLIRPLSGEVMSGWLYKVFRYTSLPRAVLATQVYLLDCLFCSYQVVIVYFFFALLICVFFFAAECDK